jgi:hypothetical protein
MGINFLYIGRDEHTLKDRLLIESRLDELPLELNLTSAFGLTMGLLGNNTSAFNLSNILATLGLPKDTDLSKFIPGIPRAFNTSNPYVEAPFQPFQPAAINFTFPGMVPGLPPGFNGSDPTIVKIVDGMLKVFVTGLPKDFSVGNIFVPGGIVVSEMETLMEAMIKSGLAILGPQAWPKDIFGNHNRVVTKSMYKLGLIQ